MKEQNLTAIDAQARAVFSLVLYCLVRDAADGNGTRFLVLHNRRGWTFPPTPLRQGEDLYSTLVRPTQEDLGLPKGSYFPEKELGVITNDIRDPRYEGMTDRWYRYPVDISLTPETREVLSRPRPDVRWMTLREIEEVVDEPNVLAITNSLRDAPPEALPPPRERHSMDATA